MLQELNTYIDVYKKKKKNGYEKDNDFFKRVLTDNDYVIFEDVNDEGEAITGILRRERNEWVPIKSIKDLNIKFGICSKAIFDNLLTMSFDEFMNDTEIITETELNEYDEEIKEDLNLRCSKNRCIKFKLAAKQFINMKYSIKLIEEELKKLEHNLLKPSQKTDKFKNIKESNINKDSNQISLNIRQFLDINKIQDPDERLINLKKFIFKNGTGWNNKSDKYLYWNSNIKKKLCCKHYLDLISLAHLPNSKKQEKIDKIVKKWSVNPNGGGILIDGTRIICSNCGRIRPNKIF